MAFFHSWKRKLGVVSLLLACLCLAGWIRCRSYEDWGLVRVGETVFLIRSDRGGFSCNRWSGDLPKPPWFGSHPVQQITVLGLGAGGARRDAIFIDYSVGTIALTILSAYLLLSPSRSRMPTDVAEIDSR